MTIDRSRSQELLDELCTTHPDREVGRPGNTAANELFAHVCGNAGLEIEHLPFKCLVWEHGDATLRVAGHESHVLPGPYSPALKATAPLAAVDTIDALEDGEFAGSALLLHGELTREQLMPKNFVFYNPAMSKRIVAALEQQQPVAVLASTAKNPNLAGSLYPFPLVDDGDFDLPTAYMKDTEGTKLLDLVGREADLSIDSRRIAGHAEQLVARKPGTGAGRIVVTGHIDSKAGSPGALDNATGTLALLLLAESLGDYAGAPSIELVPLNGEDHYSAGGQMTWLAANRDRLDNVIVNINLDAAGCVGVRTAVTTYGCPEHIEHAVHESVDSRPKFFMGDPWFQSDHSIFLQKGIPAIAITSENFAWLSEEITHTTRDSVEMVDANIMVDVARYLREIIERMTS
ncbi:MAG: M28 family peptidase [Actinomycetota bacterium]|nr:M28 family peptidase [Actinomycetota bacterium]